MHPCHTTYKEKVMSRNFFIVVYLTVAVNTGMGLIVPILPNLLQSYGYSTAGLSLPFLSLIIGRIISKSFAPAIIGMLKNKVTLVLSFMLYGGTFICYTLLDNEIAFIAALVNNGTAFIALRFFEGVVEGISIICLTDLAIILSKENRGKLMGIFGSSFGVGFVLGPLIGGFSYRYGGTDAIFYAGSGLAVIGMLVSLTLPSSDNVPVKNSSGWIRSALEHAQFFPKYGPSLIRRAIFFSFMIVLPLYANHYLGVDATYVALFFTSSAIISATLMPFTGKLADRIKPEKILSISLILMAMLIIGFGFTTDLYIFAALFLTESLCFAFMLPAGMKVFADAVDTHPSRTVIVSAYGGVTEVITLLLAVLLPYLYSLDAQASWIFIGSICALAALPFLRVSLRSAESQRCPLCGQWTSAHLSYQMPAGQSDESI